MPTVSAKQHNTMEMAEHNPAQAKALGFHIPVGVAHDFNQADKGRDFHTAMAHHGVARGANDHKRHPATSHYSMGRHGNKYPRSSR